MDRRLRNKSIMANISLVMMGCAGSINVLGSGFLSSRNETVRWKGHPQALLGTNLIIALASFEG
jgi:hypothetical protein